MPTLKSIRRRIASTRSTQKITRAMKLVSAARLRRAQDAILAARPYAERLHEVIAELGARAEAADHPLLARREPRAAEVVVLTSDRGLCGAFNANLNRRAEALLGARERFPELRLSTVGRKGRDYFRHRGVARLHEWPGLAPETALERAGEIARALIDDFLTGGQDAVLLVYNEFRSAGSQRVTVEELLPIRPRAIAEGPSGDFLYEPDKRGLLDHLLPLHVETQVYRAALESIASELGARMTAMENATRNADEMIRKLTLQYNRARQAAITKELLDIIGGAEALKK